MPVRHYDLQQSVNDGPWTTIRSDETPCSGKQFIYSGSTGDSVKLGLLPLSGNATRIVSNAVVIPDLGNTENLTATAQSSITVADLATWRDNQLAQAGITVSASDAITMNEALLVAAGVSASVTDSIVGGAQVYTEDVYADSYATGSLTDNQGMMSSLQATSSANAGLIDLAVLTELLSTTTVANTSVNVVQVMLEQVQSAIVGTASISGEVYTPGAVAPNAPTISAAGGSGQVTITLVTPSGNTPTSYTLRYATTPGGPYTSITGIATTAFPYTHTIAAGTYYYVLAGVNGAGTGPNSAEVGPVTVTPSTETIIDDFSTGGWTTENSTVSAVNHKGTLTVTGAYDTAHSGLSKTFNGLAAGTLHFHYTATMSGIEALAGFQVIYAGAIQSFAPNTSGAPTASPSMSFPGGTAVITVTLDTYDEGPGSFVVDVFDITLEAS